MSIKCILEAMEAKVGHSARKLVLIKLADNANDEGVCFPSYQNIADHCEMSKRSVMTHIARLESDGFLTKTARKTKNGNTSNSYKLSILGSESISLPSENISPPPSENISPRTCHSFEPVKEPKRKEKEKFSVPEFVNLTAWNEFEQHRLEIKKPMSDLARGKAVNKLRELSHDEQQAVIDYSIQGRYTGLFPEIIEKQRQGNYAKSGGFGRESVSERNARISKETTRQHQEAVAQALADGTF